MIHQNKRKVAVIVGEDAYNEYGDGASQFIATHITEWVEVTQEEHVALQNWCYKQYQGKYRVIEDVTRILDIKEIMKEAKVEQAKREQAENVRKAKALANKAAKKKLKEDEKRALYEQLKKELGA